MNRLTQAAGTSYTWDDKGNLIGKNEGSDTWEYECDFADWLITILLNNTVRIRSHYDAGGRRI